MNLFLQCSCLAQVVKPLIKEGLAFENYVMSFSEAMPGVPKWVRPAMENCFYKEGLRRAISDFDDFWTSG